MSSIYRLYLKYDDIKNLQNGISNSVETETSDRTLIGLDQLLKCFSLSSYPFHFSFADPLGYTIKEYKNTLYSK